MAENSETTGQRERSPSYPLISLEAALDRLVAFEAHFKRSPARPENVQGAWGIKARARVDRITAALRYFGLLDYQGTGKDRQIVISEEGRKYLRAQQDEIKREVVKAAALRPKEIAKFWNEWGKDRPANAACLDELVFKHGFSEAGAREFLKVYDATITYAGLSDSDKMPLESKAQEEQEPDEEPEPFAGQHRKVKLMQGERVVFTEENDPQQYVKLIACGNVDDLLLDALGDYIKRQKRRVGRDTNAGRSEAEQQQADDLNDSID